jgi:hypothetical protein
VTVTWLPLDATDLEAKTFEDSRGGMTQGWGGTFDYLVKYLEQGK